MSSTTNTRRLRRGSRLLCPECGSVKALEFQNEADEAFLECGHHRTSALLDPHPGCLSIEHVSAGDKLALRLFPATDVDGQRIGRRDFRDVLSDLTQQEQRDAWSLAA